MPKKEETSVIKNEEQFVAIKENISIKDTSFRSDKFDELEMYVKEALTRQDSEKALILITKGALSFGSSDIHYDMHEKEVVVRFRIDGNLADVFSLPFEQYKLILERLKYKSDLKMNITDIPQDGKYRILDGEKKIDVRISTLPVKLGENVVCRVLDLENAIVPLESLGFMWTSKRQVEKSLKKKNGMVLVTGPTGSGKTTTLYSMLSHLNTAEKKVITLEDPIEYELPGVVQSEVNEKKWYSYAQGLKALMRQDPDIIMIGEIRDLETANIAAQASLTGHLVLATLHTKSASETLERLMNMGMRGYVLAASIDLIIAQRLVRKICPHCREDYEADHDQTEIIKWMMKDIGIENVGKAKKDTAYKLYRGAGCEKCGNSGYKGRLGVFEVLYFTQKIRDLIRDWASPAEILDEARKNDLMVMREDGILKAMKGETTLEELFKVID